MSSWTSALVKSVARQDFVLFVGSGVSASCVSEKDGARPPTWRSLIEGASQLISKSAARNRILSAAKKDLLDAAEALLFEADAAGRRVDVLEYIVKAVEGTSGNPYLPSEWHDQLLRLDPLVIVTTNYDRILERATKNGFSTLSMTATNTAREIRVGNPVIIKVHGSVDDRESMIMSQTQYARIRARHVNNIEVIRSLFVTKPCIFVGYSLGDPDVRLLLENIVSDSQPEPAHYLLGPKPSSSHVKRMFAEAYGVQLVSYKAGNHSDGLRMLKELADLVDAERSG